MSDEYDDDATYTEADLVTAAKLARLEAERAGMRTLLAFAAAEGLSAASVLKALSGTNAAPSDPPVDDGDDADDDDTDLWTPSEAIEAAFEIAEEAAAAGEDASDVLELLAERVGSVSKAFDESKVKRDHGKFSSTGGASGEPKTKTGKVAAPKKPTKTELKQQRRSEAKAAAHSHLKARASGKTLNASEAADLIGHLAHLTHADLRELRKEHGASFGGERRKGNRTASLVKWAKNEIGKKRRAQQGSALQQTVDYGGIDPNSADFKRFYGSMKDAVNDGVPMAAFKRGGNGLDEIAAQMVSAGHISLPDWEDPSEHLIGLLRGRKMLSWANTDAKHEGAYAEHVAAQLESDDGSATFDPNKEWDDEDPDWFSKAFDLHHDATDAERLSAAVEVALQALEDGSDPEEALARLHEHGTFAKAWDKDKHPRDDKGRFVSKDAIQAAKSDPKKAKELKKRVTDPEQRKKLDAALADPEVIGTKRGLAKHESETKRAEKVANRAKAREIRIRLIDQDSRGEELNPDDLRALIPHLGQMSHEELSHTRELLARQGASFNGKRLRADRVAALVQWATGKAQGGADGGQGDTASRSDVADTSGGDGRDDKSAQLAAGSVPTGRGQTETDGGAGAISGEQTGSEPPRSKWHGVELKDIPDRAERLEEFERRQGNVVLTPARVWGDLKELGYDSYQRGKPRSGVAGRGGVSVREVPGKHTVVAISTEPASHEADGYDYAGAANKLEGELKDRGYTVTRNPNGDPNILYARKPFVEPSTESEPPVDTKVDGKEPWEMTGGEWEAARDKFKNYDSGGGVGKVGPKISNEIRNRVLTQLSRGDKLRMGLSPIDPDTNLPRNVQHRDVIEHALKQGKPVPAEVLADYPDLAAKYAKPDTGTAAAQPAPTGTSAAPPKTPQDEVIHSARKHARRTAELAKSGAEAVRKYVDDEVPTDAQAEIELAHNIKDLRNPDAEDLKALATNTRRPDAPAQPRPVQAAPVPAPQQPALTPEPTPAPASGNIDKVYSIADAAKELGISPQEAMAAFDAKKLRGYRVPGLADDEEGGGPRIPHTQLERFRKEQGGTAAAPPKTRLQALAEKAHAAGTPNDDPNTEYATPRDQYLAFTRAVVPPTGTKPDSATVLDYLNKLPDHARERLDQHFRASGKSLREIEQFHRQAAGQVTPAQVRAERAARADAGDAARAAMTGSGAAQDANDKRVERNVSKWADRSNLHPETRAMLDRPAAELTEDEARKQLAALSSSRSQRSPGAEFVQPGSPTSKRIADRVNELRERLRQQPWQRTQRAVQGATGLPPHKHKQAVSEALAAGKTVPPEVLADYPDLAANYGQSGSGAAPTPTGTSAAPDLAALKKNPKADVEHIAALQKRHAEGSPEWEALETARFNAQNVHTRDNSALAALHGKGKDAEAHGRRHFALERLASAAAQAHKSGDAAGHKAATDAVTSLGGTLHGPKAGETTAFDGSHYDGPVGAFTGDSVRVTRQPVKYNGALVYRGKVEPVASGSGAAPAAGGGGSEPPKVPPAPAPGVYTGNRPEVERIQGNLREQGYQLVGMTPQHKTAQSAKEAAERYRSGPDGDRYVFAVFRDGSKWGVAKRPNVGTVKRDT